MITTAVEQFLRKLSAANVYLHLGESGGVRIAGPADFLDGSDWQFLKEHQPEIVSALREREARRQASKHILGPRPPRRQRQWKSRTTRATAIAFDLNPTFWEPLP